MKILNRLDNYINEKEYSMIYKYNKLFAVVVVGGVENVEKLCSPLF